MMNPELGFQALCAYKMVLDFFLLSFSSHEMHAVHLPSENDLAAFRLGTLIGNTAACRRQVTWAYWKEKNYGCVWEEARTKRKVWGWNSGEKSLARTGSGGRGSYVCWCHSTASQERLWDEKQPQRWDLEYFLKKQEELLFLLSVEVTSFPRNSL